MFPDWLVAVAFFLGVGIGWVACFLGIGIAWASRMCFDSEARKDDYRRRDRPLRCPPAPTPRSPMLLEDDRESDVRRRFEAGEPLIEAAETVGENTDWSPAPAPDSGWIFYSGTGSSGPEGVVGYRAIWLREITDAPR